MNSVARSAGLIYLGMDTSKDKIAVGILRGDATSPDVEMIFNDEVSIRRLISRFPDPGQLRMAQGTGSYLMRRRYPTSRSLTDGLPCFGADPGDL